MEKALTKPQVIAELTRSPHGKLSDYLPVGLAAAREDPDFFAHLVAWNKLKGQVRDAQVALPVIALAVMPLGRHMGKGDAHPALTINYAENALAHVALLDPRMLVQALDFAKDVRAPQRLLRRLAERYLREREATHSWWNATAVQHREVLRRLYARYHIAPAGRKGNRQAPSQSFENRALFLEVASGRFAAIRSLGSMAPEEAAAAIIDNKIPFVVARGALGARAKDPDVVLALIKRMSPSELVTNMKLLKRLGVQEVPALRAALEEAIGKAATAKPRRGGTLKATRAAETLEAAGDTVLAGKLRALQEKQLDALGGIEGDWLVIGDKSGSMSAAIEGARQVAAVLARSVRGRVHLVFVDELPRYTEATGWTYETLVEKTRGVSAGGGTCLGCGLQYVLENRLPVEGIAVVSDGGENRPPYFADAYQRYVARTGTTPSVYFYRLPGDPDVLTRNMAMERLDLQVFDLAGKAVDYASLPNLALTMRVGRYQLLDEILATDLLTLDAVLERTKGMPVLARPEPEAVRQ